MDGIRNCTDPLTNILHDLGNNFEEDLGNILEDDLLSGLEIGTGYSPEEFGFDFGDDEW